MTTSSNEQLQSSVIDEIRFEPIARGFEIGVSASDGVVTLTGVVNSYAEKLAVEKAVARVKGVKGVAEAITIRPAGAHARTDAEIAAAAAGSLGWHVWLQDGIPASVTNGWVTLRGAVDWDYQRVAARRAVEFLAGVIGVSNEITLKPTAKAESVKAEIEKALVRSAEIDAGTVRVVADGNDVTLSGSVRSLAERDEAAAAAWNAPGVWTVTNNLAVA